MPIDLATLRSELRVHLGGLDTTDLPDVSADLLLNRAYWEMLNKFPFKEKEISGTFDTTAGARLYTCPVPFEALRKLSIEDPDSGKHTDIDPMTIDEYENTYVANTDANARPARYIREGTNIRLWPTPDDVYTITIKYWTDLADLSNSNDETGLPRSWDEIVLFGAIWRGFARLGDYANMREAQATSASLIDSAVPIEAKEEFDRHRAGVQIPGYQPEDI